MGVDFQRLRDLKARLEEKTEVGEGQNLRKAHHEELGKTSRQTAHAYSAKNYTERREAGIFKIAKSENATPDGQLLATSKRLAVGPLEIIQNTKDAAGFVRKEIFNIPIWQRGQKTGLAEQVQERVSTPLEVAKQKQVASANAEVEKSNSKSNQQQVPPKATVVPEQQSAQQTINRYYNAAGVTGKDKNSQAGFDKVQAYAANLGPDHLKAFNAALAERRNPKQSHIDSSIPKTDVEKSDSKSRQEQAPPKATIVPEQQSAQQTINKYYNAAGVTGKDKNSQAGFNKVQAYAASLGPDHLKAFNAALAERRNSN